MNNEFGIVLENIMLFYILDIFLMLFFQLGINNNCLYIYGNLSVVEFYIYIYVSIFIELFYQKY
jgi:hypothetical protein